MTESGSLGMRSGARAARDFEPQNCIVSPIHGCRYYAARGRRRNLQFRRDIGVQRLLGKLHDHEESIIFQRFYG